MFLSFRQIDSENVLERDEKSSSYEILPHSSSE